MEIRKKILKGGYSFKDFQGKPESTCEKLDLPESVIHPLIHCESTKEVLVKKGDYVNAGQILWENESIISSPVIATINGHVEQLKSMIFNNKKALHIVIRSDGTDTWTPLEGYNENFNELSDSEIEKLLYDSSVTSLGLDGIPTRFKTSILGCKDVKHIIVKHTESDVYHPNLSVLLEDNNLEDFNDGLSILKKIMPQSKTHLVLNKKNKPWVNTLSHGPFDEMVQIKAKYPQSMDQLVAELVTGQKIPSHCSVAHGSVLILEVQTLIQVSQAVKRGKPLIDKIVCLAGPGFEKRSHVKVRIGTSFDRMIKDRLIAGETRLIINSAMTGSAIESLKAPVEANCSQLIALKEERIGEIMLWVKPGFRKHSIMHTFANDFFPISKRNDTNLNGEERACLSCGNCYNVCPAGIYPTQLFKYVERDKIDETLMKYGIFKCMDCNLCTYVCTAKIPLANLIKEGKERLFQDSYISQRELLEAYSLSDFNKEEVIDS